MPGWDIEGERAGASRIVERVILAQELYGPGGTIWRPDADAVWLDVGFGAGSILFAAGEHGFLPVGLEVRKAPVEAMGQFGIEASVGEITEYEGRRPSVVSASEVLEHVRYPLEWLQSAHLILVEGGLLYLSCPNMDTVLWRAWDVAGINPYWAELEHAHNFTRKILYEILERTGFKPVHYGVSERYRCCCEIIARRV